ncbi:hypothetical protein BHM03_00033253 [Ensete ventricosum]|nr:hypothetical protein BHM03_00033253 [Ensete ventricosum]
MRKAAYRTAGIRCSVVINSNEAQSYGWNTMLLSSSVGCVFVAAVFRISTGRRMVRLSNGLIGALNVITLLLSVPILGGGIWLSQRGATDCERFLDVPLIAIGVFVFLVSLAGCVGACFRNSCLLWLYLAVMLLLVCFTIFAFVVTNKGAGHAVSGRGSWSTASATTPTGSREGWRTPRTGGASGAAWCRARCARICRTRTRRGISSSTSYVGHVVTTIPDKSPTTCRRGHCTLVGCCVCLDTPPVASCQGSGGTVRRSVTASALTCACWQLSRVRGYCSLVGCCLCPDTPLVTSCRGSGGIGRGLVWHVDSIVSPVIRGELVDRRAARGYPKVGSGGGRMLDVAES